MRVLIRIFCLILLAASLIAARENYEYLLGDLKLYSVPSVNNTLSKPRAARLQLTLQEGLKLNPMNWEGLFKNAAYLTFMNKYDEALDQIKLIQSVYVPWGALLLEASIYEKIGNYERAQRMFQLVHRNSPLDRRPIQHLLRLYMHQKKYKELDNVALEAELRWANAFDTMVARGNSVLELSRNRDTVMTFKYFLLAGYVPVKNRPRPEVFQMSDIQDRICTASEILGYDSDWARWCD